MADTGGYDCRLVDAPPDRLVCGICHLPCRETRLTSCCGHSFCESCFGQLRSSSNVSRACPMCRKEQFDVYPQLEADREIKALRVYCLYEDQGCGWIGELSSLLEHKFSRDKPILKCMRCDKCNEVIHYTDLTSHFTTDCPCYCQHCKITAEREVIDNLHKEKCLKLPLPCPNNCGLDKIPRDGMDVHRMECPLELIQCCHCKAEITRNDKEKHDNENKIEHLQLMCDEKFKTAFNELQGINVSVDGIKQEVSRLIETMSNSSTSNRIDNDLLNQPFFNRSKLITAVLCVLIAILVMIFQSSFMQNKNEMQQQQQQIPMQEILDMLKVANNGINEQNDTCKGLLAQTKMRLNELEENVKTYKTKLQQAKSIQTKLETDIKNLKHKQSMSETKPTNKSELQTELNKLNYIWSLAMNIYKSCKNLYDHISSDIAWSEMMFLCDEMSLQGDQVAPVIVKMSNYTEKMKNKKQWYSSPFFTFEEGYKLQIRIDPAVYGDGEITHDHVFVYLFLLKGRHDDELTVQQSGDWPTKGTFTIELLNQLNDSDHRSSEVIFTCNSVTCNFKAAKRYSPTGHLTAHETICYQITSGYLQNDSLYFRVSYKDTRYDYYYYYHFTKYVLLPTAALIIAVITNEVVFNKMRLKKLGNIIFFGTGFIVGSLLVGNLLGGILWGVMTGLISVLVFLAWEKCTGNDVSQIAVAFVVLVASILTNILLVDVLSMPWNIMWLIF